VRFACERFQASLRMAPLKVDRVLTTSSDGRREGPDTGNVAVRGAFTQTFASTVPILVLATDL